MTPAKPFAVRPGQGLGPFHLRAPLHSILTYIKTQKRTFPQLDISFSPNDPVQQPVVVTLPRNGLRLRFDGQSQRLRLIEVVDFSLVQLQYEGKDVVRPSNKTHGQPAGPGFKWIYDRLFGPTFPGEYVDIGSIDGQKSGLYILSYPGLAFTFPLKSKPSPEQLSDFVGLLSSPSAPPAKSIAIFNGPSWHEARSLLFEMPSLRVDRALSKKRGNKVGPLDAIDHVIICDKGRLCLVDTHKDTTFDIILGSTTPQDIVTQLGPPDAVYNKSDRRLSIHQRPPRRDQGASAQADEDYHTTDTSPPGASRRSGNTLSTNPTSECFYNYFRHGIDFMLSTSPPISTSHRTNDISSSNSESEEDLHVIQPGQFTAMKVLLHGNVPGSFTFNRYSRCRWTIGYLNSVDSESSFTRIAEALDDFENERTPNTSTTSTREGLRGKTGRQGRPGMMLNRNWGNSPGSSMELLGGFDDDGTYLNDDDDDNAHDYKEDDEEFGGEADTDDDDAIAAVTAALPGQGTTELFGFPGLVFEVLKNDVLSCVTIF